MTTMRCICYMMYAFKTVPLFLCTVHMQNPFEHKTKQGHRLVDGGNGRYRAVATGAVPGEGDAWSECGAQAEAGAAVLAAAQHPGQLVCCVLRHAKRSAADLCFTAVRHYSSSAIVSRCFCVKKRALCVIVQSCSVWGRSREGHSDTPRFSPRE